jgi:ABC-type oligopeptide transport system ATPase subunit
MDPALESALQNDISSIVMDDVTFRIQRNLNFIISIIGATGSGKSTVGQHIYSHACDVSGDKLTVDDIIFEQTELLERLKNVYTGHTFIIDEHFTLRTGTGSFREEQMIQWLQQIIRAFQINFIFCCPLEVNNLSHYILKTMDIDYEHRTNRSVVHTIDLEPGGFIRITPIGYLVSPFIEIKGYKEKKMEFIQTRLQQKGTQLQEKHHAIADQIIKNYNLPKNVPNKVIKVLVEKIEPSLADTEIERIADYIKAEMLIKDAKKPEKIKTKKG